MLNRKAFLGFFVFVCLGWCAPTKYVVVAVLDKVTTKVQVFCLNVGDEVVVRERIKVRVPACDAPPESSFHQDHKKCFVEVYDCGIRGGEEHMLMAKWMFRDYPVVGSLEHSRYDVWLIDCSNSLPKEWNGGGEKA